MPQFRWKNRREFIERVAIRSYISFVKVQEWIASDPHDLDVIIPAITLDDELSSLIEGYRYNVDDWTMRSIKATERDVLMELYEYGRLYKNNQLMAWLKGKING